MKKIAIIISCWLLLSAESFSQSPVSVVTAPRLEVLAVENKSNLLKQLAEAGRQSKALQESSELLKKSADLYYTINKKISSVISIKRLAEAQVNLIKEAAKAVSEGRKLKTSEPSMLLNYIANINGVVAMNSENVQLMNSVMTEGLRLSDAERLRFLEDLQERTEKNLTKIRNMRASYGQYVSVINFLSQK